MVRSARYLAAAIFSAAAVNFLALVILERYDIRLGPLHLTASYLFKPLLYLNAAFLINLALQAGRGNAETLSPPSATQPLVASRAFWLPAVLLMAAVYGVTFAVNLDYPDWTHRALTTGRTFASFFTERQYDGFYRPLSFLSLWVDNAVFGPTLWAYHIQNLLLHLLNGYLVARLALRLGFNRRPAQWAGIAFLVVPGLFEAVIWPGARFDLLAAAFLFFALERALAGSFVTSTIAYALGVLCKETAYAYPILLVALFVLRRPLDIRLLRTQWTRIFAAAAVASVALILVRVAVYGNLGGYPDATHPGHSVNFVLSKGTLTSVFTRLPAALFLFNSGAELPLWFKATLIGYTIALALVTWKSATAGKGTWLFLLSFAAVAPMANMFGWMTPFAQQGRYLYSPAVWIVLPLVLAISSLRFSRTVFVLWLVVSSAATLFNNLAYVRLVRRAQTAVAEASWYCKREKCCQQLVVQNLPKDLYGAFYFGYQVKHDLEKALPGVAVSSDETSLQSTAACVVTLHWSDDGFKVNASGH